MDNYITGALIKRLREGKNLTQEELRKRYSAQIVSRLEGEYQTLLFVGKDIRRQKAANS